MKRTVIWLFLVILFCFRCGAATLDVTSFGAVGNCTTILVNVTSGSATVTANSGTPFSSADVGKTVQIYGGGPKTTITTTTWGSSPTNNADIVAQISAFVNNTTVTLDRNCGNTTNATFMRYGTNNLIAFNNCIAAAGNGDTIHIPAGNYHLVNPSATNASFVQSGTFDAGTPVFTLTKGGITFLGDGTNSTILSAAGAWQIRGLQQAFRGTLFRFNSITANNAAVIFKDIQFDGGATQNHSQLYVGVPAAPTDGSGWDVTHHAIVYAADPTALPLLSVTNCLFVHWHGETVEGTDSGTGVVDVGNTFFIDGNATAVNFNGVHSYHECYCTNYYQFAEDGQFKSASGVNVIKNNRIVGIDHLAFAITGAQSNQPAPSFVISNNVFGVTGNVRALGTAGVHDVLAISNYFTGPVELGISGNQGTFGNSNIVVILNVFSNSPNCILLSGDTGLNKIYSVIITNNSGSNITRWADATVGGWGTNIVFANNRGDSSLHSIDTSGQYFLDDPSNLFPPWTTAGLAGTTNAVSYGLGRNQRIQDATFYLDNSLPNKIPPGAQLTVTNSGASSLLLFPSSDRITPVSLAAGKGLTYYWSGTQWTAHRIVIDQSVSLPAGRLGAHGFLYAKNKIWASLDSSPGVLLRFNSPSNDLSNYDTLTFPSDGNHVEALDCIYIPGKDKIYVVFSRAANLTVSEVDPVTLSFTDVISTGTASFGQSMCATTTHLFVGCNQGVIKYALADWSETGRQAGLGQVHCCRYDGTNVYASATDDNWVEKIDPTTLTFTSATFPPGVAQPTNTMGYDGSNLWLGPENTNTVLKVDKGTLSITQVSGPIPATGIYGVFNDASVQFVWNSLFSSTTNVVQLINAYTLSVESFTLPSQFVLPSEIVSDGTFIYVATFADQAEVIRLFPTLGPVTNTAASCSGPDIQAAIAASLPGDTVVVPVGTCAPTISILLTNQISVIGNGVTLQDSIINTSDGANSSIFQVAVGPLPALPTRIAGFTFVTGGRATRMFDSGNIHLSGGANLVRIDHNTFNAGLNIGIGGGSVFGVIDHNVFDALGSFTAPMKLNHDSYGGGSFGDGAWALPMWTNGAIEDASAIYIEDNLMTNNSGAPGLGIDSQGGARIVVRHNTFSRMIAGGHGTETTGRERGSRVKDVYNNLWANNFGDSECGHYRSGTGMVVSNTVVNSSGFMTIRVYRMLLGGFWGPANGTNAWDNNDPVIYGAGTATAGGSLQFSDATKTWTPNQWQGIFTIRNVGSARASVVQGNTVNTATYSGSPDTSTTPDLVFNPGDSYQFRKLIKVLDQPGRGQGSLISGSPPTPVAWPNQALEPIYSWSNTFISVSGGQTLNNGGYYPVVDGVELINAKNTSWVPFTYPHPLVSGTASGPIITSQPQSTNIFVTQTAFFSVAVNSGGLPTVFYWITNGVSDGGVNGATITFVNCPTNLNNMSVVCLVSNTSGTATSATATLMVKPDPIITGQPANQTVGVGQVAHFTVTASGQSTLQYLWSKNGTPIAGATASLYNTPAAVSGDNNSQFSVVVTDNAGSLTSATATLTVTNIPSPPDPVITSQPQSTNIFATQTAIFSITATGASTLHYQWKTNGVNAGTDSSTLIVGPAPVAWSGMTIICRVTDLAGFVDSSIATLTVGPDPVISGQPVNITTGTGATAMFQVTATGQTALSYQWNRNGSPVGGATFSSYTTPALTILNNGDTYFVDVTDLAGTLRSSTATLTVTNGAAPPSRIAKVNILRVGSTKTGP